MQIFGGVSHVLCQTGLSQKTQEKPGCCVRDCINFVMSSCFKNSNEMGQPLCGFTIDSGQPSLSEFGCLLEILSEDCEF
jgi:hypothetical protein